GSWQRGSRDLYRFVGASLAAQGIVTVVPDYSIFPPARFPMFIEDAARAVRFARDNATQWGGDPARLVLMGHSAGAYIAATARENLECIATPLRDQTLEASCPSRHSFFFWFLVSPFLLGRVKR